MTITFIGVGEAFDELYSNNSSLVHAGDTTILLDCGYSIPQEYWTYDCDPGCPDAIFVSHLHADHYFGVQALLMRMLEEGRKKGITIIGQTGIGDAIKKNIEAAYADVYDKFEFPITYLEVEPNSQTTFADLELSFAPTNHTVPNIAIRIDQNGQSVCYSGDGMPTAESSELYRDCDVLVHEAYLGDHSVFGHAYVNTVVEMAEKMGVKRLALTHLNREYRAENAEQLRSSFKDLDVKVFLPDPADEIDF